MWLPMALVDFLVVSTQAWVSAPLKLGTQAHATVVLHRAGQLGKESILASRALPDGVRKLDSNGVSQFTLKADNTVSWDVMGLCIEANGNGYGDGVCINRCTGKPNQLWDFLPAGKNQIQIQLKNTDKCMSTANYIEGGLNEVPVELRDCVEKGGGLWTFDKPVIFSTQAPSRRSEFPSSWRHVAVRFSAFAAVGASIFSYWTWRRLRLRPIAITESQGGLPSNYNQGGISLTVPLAVGQPSPVDMVSSPMAREEHVSMDALIFDDALFKIA